MSPAKTSLLVVLTALATALALRLTAPTQGGRGAWAGTLEPAGGTPLPAEALEGLRAQLDRIESRLKELELEPPVAGPARAEGTLPDSTRDEPSARLPAGGDQVTLASLSLQLAELRGLLDEHVQEGRAEREANLGLARAKELRPEPDWERLQALIDLQRVDEARALREVRLLTPADVVRRFGSPTEVWHDQNGSNWLFGADRDGSGRYHTEVWMCFQDGYVTMLGVR